MKSVVFGIAAAGLLMGGVSLAQTTQGTGPAGTVATTVTPTSPQTPAASGNSNQAVASTNANAATPAKGANSFTMGEAKSRLEKNGFSDVTDLAKDDNGVWRGKAQRGGSAAMVWLDYKGNVGEGK